MNNAPINSFLRPEQSPDLHLLAAKLGLAGHQIHKLNDGFLVYRLNLVKYCKDYAELVAFAKKIGVFK
jgi:hypothetical protein